MELNIGPEVSSSVRACGCRYTKHGSGAIRVAACLPHAVETHMRSAEQQSRVLHLEVRRLADAVLSAANTIHRKPVRLTFWGKIRRWWMRK